ncbi:MAG TPA: divergent polysaccharide deacetylase family protein [Gammaproteobacteria bacterium]|nr:divergent polysaccharide deacetylase family protein [Gammaproteobacteria bacterium]
MPRLRERVCGEDQARERRRCSATTSERNAVTVARALSRRGLASPRLDGVARRSCSARLHSAPRALPDRPTGALRCGITSDRVSKPRAGKGAAYGLLLAVAALALHAPPAAARDPRPGVQGRISIIIDDLGQELDPGEQAVSLPGPVACAFLPDRPHTRQLADRAWRNGKEVMLHLPLEAIRDLPLGAGGITLDMGPVQFRRVVRRDLRAVPHVQGVNNHEGSLMTRNPGDMAWLMQVLRRHGRLFFVDSRTTPKSVAAMVAGEWGIPHTSRNVFLDDVRTEKAIAAQFQHLVTLARRDGVAVAIGHPYPQTLKFLRKALPELAREHIRLIPVHRAIRIQQERETWRASSSPAPSAAHGSAAR